jgi:hypothetical protein
LKQAIENHLKSTKSKQQKKRLTCNEANEKAMRLARSDSSFARAPTIRRWAKAIGCSTGLVSKLPFWQKCKAKLGSKESAKRPKVVAFTKPLEDTLGQDDPELKRLIEEQEADCEPSSLDNTPKYPRSRRHKL